MTDSSRTDYIVGGALAVGGLIGAALPVLARRVPFPPALKAVQQFGRTYEKFIYGASAIGFTAGVAIAAKRYWGAVESQEKAVQERLAGVRIPAHRELPTTDGEVDPFLDSGSTLGLGDRLLLVDESGDFSLSAQYASDGCTLLDPFLLANTPYGCEAAIDRSKLIGRQWTTLVQSLLGDLEGVVKAELEGSPLLLTKEQWGDAAELFEKEFGQLNSGTFKELLEKMSWQLTNSSDRQKELLSATIQLRITGTVTEQALDRILSSLQLAPYHDAIHNRQKELILEYVRSILPKPGSGDRMIIVTRQKHIEAVNR